MVEGSVGRIRPLHARTQGLWVDSFRWPGPFGTFWAEGGSILLFLPPYINGLGPPLSTAPVCSIVPLPGWALQRAAPHPWSRFWKKGSRIANNFSSFFSFSFVKHASMNIPLDV